MGTGTVVIVGASHAAVQAIDTLRREGHEGRIVLVGDEPHLPYNRPPLSKKYLSGEMERERLYLRSSQFYEQSRTEVRLGLRVTAIDRTDRRLRLSDGDELQYDKLLLCLGSRNRLLEVPGSDLGGIHYLRTIADVDAIRTSLVGARSLVVVGAGYIGLEAAASARHLGLDVTVLEMADRPMNRVVAPEMSSFYLRRHEREGVRVLCNMSVTGFVGTPEGRVRAVRCGEQEFAGRFRHRRGRHPAGNGARRRLRSALRERHLRRRAVPDLGPERLCGRRLHVSPEPALRTPDAPRIGGQRRRAGEDGGDEHLWQAGQHATSHGSGRTSTT